MPRPDRSAILDMQPPGRWTAADHRLPRLDSLQVLRGIAAFSIVILHAVQEAEALSHRLGSTFHAPALPLAAGVDAFFVLSSFLLVGQLARPRVERPSAGKFFLKRAIRVAPLYWGVTTAYLLVFLVAPRTLNSGRPSFLYVAASYLFIPFLNQEGANEPVYKLGWSLNCEMFFYLMLTVFSQLSPRRLVTGIALSLGALILARREAGAAAGPVLSLWGNPLMLDFFWGAVLGWAYSAGIRVKDTVGKFLVAAGLMALIAGSVGHWEPTWAIRSVQWGLPCAACVAGLGLSRRQSPDSPGLFKSGLILLGDASYALYLVHPFILRLAQQIWVRNFAASAPSLYAYILVAATAATLAAVAVFRYLEQPLLRGIRARAKLWRSGASTATLTRHSI